MFLQYTITVNFMGKKSIQATLLSKFHIMEKKKHLFSLKCFSCVSLALALGMSMFNL